MADRNEGYSIITYPRNAATETPTAKTPGMIYSKGQSFCSELPAVAVDSHIVVTRRLLQDKKKISSFKFNASACLCAPLAEGLPRPGHFRGSETPQKTIAPVAGFSPCPPKSGL